MKKIVAISDTHCVLKEISLPKGDILIHAGDLTYVGNIGELERELDVLAEIRTDFKDVVLIAGNHDKLAEQNPYVMQKMCEDRDLLYLNDSQVHTEGLTIYGSPISPTFPRKGLWAFNRDRGEEIKAHWDLIPEGLDVLITHGPPYGIRDDVQDHYNGQIRSVGCVDLMAQVIKVKPQVHIFGHIHSGHGTTVKNGTIFINASSLNEQYRVAYEPIVIEIEGKENDK